MKITAKVSNLLQVVNIVNKAVGDTNTTLDITRSILIDVKDNVAKFTCYNVKKALSIESSIAITADQNGSVLIDCSMFQSILSKLNEKNDVTLEFVEGSVIITSGKIKFSLSTDNVEKFPKPMESMVDDKTKKSIVVSTSAFNNMVKGVIFAVGTNDANKTMTGINFVKKDKTLTATTLDGHRIAINEIAVDSGDDIDIIASATNIDSICKILSGDNVSITSNGTIAEFASGNTIARTQLINGPYFKIAQTLQIDTDKEIVIDKKEFKAAIDRAKIFTNTPESRLPVVLQTSKGNLNISVCSRTGATSEDISCDIVGEIKIGFNPTFLSDMLNVIKDDKITMSLSTSKAPCFVKGDGYTYLVLPVNIVNQ